MNICCEEGCDVETRGLRCDQHNRRHTAMEWARRYDQQDKRLLEDVSQGLTSARLAVRLNRSRQWADRVIGKARRRQAMLSQK